MQTIEMSYDEWVDKFNATPHDDVPPDIDEHFVWTALDGDNGEYCVSEGIHWVNRIRYYVSEIPWEDNILYNIVDDDVPEEVLAKDEMLDKYKVLGFAEGWAIVERKEDGVRGSLDFNEHDGIRYYYNFQEA